MKTEPTYRCGWRYERRTDQYNFGMIHIRRGEFHATLIEETFDDIPDAAFNDLMQHRYREAAFEHLQADLDALAPFVRLVLDGDITTWIANPPPRAPLQAAVKRWEATQADKEPTP